MSRRAPAATDERLPAAALRRRLREWYLASRRDLPWRRTRDPWAIWVSEVMLQQTTVAVGLVRYPDFLSRFPTVEAMAAATERDVLAAWSGLGYYARARNLHRGACEAVGRGGIPRTAAELRELPGIGPYTAAAIASIVHGEAAAVVDGNVLRVLSRLLAAPWSPASGRDRREAARVATELLDPSAPGDHNQAVMELGATVCTPRSPGCRLCPVAALCRARRLGTPGDFPVREPRTSPRRIVLAAGVAFRDGRLVLVPDDVFVPGHLVVPLVPVPDGVEPEAALARHWPTRAGREASGLAPLGRLAHSVLDRRYRVELFAVTEGKASAPARAPTLLSPARARTVPRGGFLEKVLARLAGLRPTGPAGAPPGRGPRAGAPPRRPGG